PARREARNADALGINAPVLGFAAHQADRPLGVLERAAGRYAFGLIRPPRHAVLEDDPGHAQRIQPRRHLFAFQFPIQVPISAARTNDDGRAAILLLRGPIDRDAGFRNVGDHARRFGHFDLLAVEHGRHNDFFRANRAWLVRNLAWPKLDD